MKDKVEEIFNDLKGRIRNPLILSFIFVWLYKHWKLVYIFFNIENSWSYSYKLKIFKQYISEHSGFIGMILQPLLLAFFSLFIYYIIAIISQAIKIYIGVRLNAQMLAKVDTGTFALKTELNGEKRSSKRIQKELTDAKDNLMAIISEKDSIENELKILKISQNDTNEKLKEANSNIYNNKSLKENFEVTVLYLLANYKGINNENLKQEKNISSYKIIEGSWRVETSEAFSSTSYQINDLVFKDANTTKLDGKLYGVISFLEYDMKNHILDFRISIQESNGYLFNLVRLNQDEFIGFQNNKFCRFKRLIM